MPKDQEKIKILIGKFWEVGGAEIFSVAHLFKQILNVLDFNHLVYVI